jgi:hypothetical protein
MNEPRPVLSNPESQATACHQYQLSKRGYESALREGELYERGGAASMQQANRYEGEAKSVSVAARNYLAAHSESCPVCKANRGMILKEMACTDQQR